MMSTLRNLGAVVAGIAAFMLLIMAVQWLSRQIYPPPDIEFGDPDQLRAFMQTIPLGAILFVGLSWATGAFGGTLVGGLIGTLKPLYFGVIIGGLVLAFSISTMFIIPHPWWFNIAAPIAVLLATFAAIRLLEHIRS